MIKPNQSDPGEVRKLIERLAQADDAEWPKLFHTLRRRKMLAITMAEINRLQGDPTRCELAQTALRRLGLDHGM